MRKKRLNLKLALKTIISIAIITLLITRVDFIQIWQKLQALSLSFVVFALIYYTGCQWLSCLRWQIILRAIGHSVSMNILVSSYFGGMFLNTFLPGSLGGDVYRVYTITRKTKDSELAFVSVFLERVTGLFALLGIALLSLIPAFKIIGRWDIILLLILCTGMLLTAIILIVSPRLLMWSEPWLEKFRLKNLAVRLATIQVLLRKFATHIKALMWTMGLSLLLQLLIVFYYYLIAQQLKIPVSYLQLLVFTAIIVLITLLPISLGGLGVKEGLLSYLFNRVGLTIDQALVLSITVTVLGWLLSLPGGLVVLLDSTGISEIKQNINKK